MKRFYSALVLMISDPNVHKQIAAMADAHAESRKWSDATIIAAGKSANQAQNSIYDYSSFRTPPSQTGADTSWLIQHWVSPANP